MPNLKRFIHALIVTLFAPSAFCQVIVIQYNGDHYTYDRPTVFTDNAATPIYSPPYRHSFQSISRRVAAVAQDTAFQSAGRAVSLSPALISAVAWRESHFQNASVSHSGAIGQMQLMPTTARELGVDASIPSENLRGGAEYLKRLMARYNGSLTLALAAYNAGPAAVDRFGGMPPYKETQAYVAAILDSLSDVALARDSEVKQVATKSIGAGDR